MASHDRHAARKFGLRAERKAEWFLRLKFYQILARNFRARDGEVDIIARRGGVVAFVEVKARPAMDDALEAVSPRKQARISRAANYWLSRNPWTATMTLRADAILIARGRWPRHVPDLFPLDIG